MHYKNFFWLHIKKSAGQSTRALLAPHYKEVNRSKNPPNFIQSSKEEYNDILNNYRIVLGEYQFKRCLFAKKFLYPNDWDQIYSFAFSREPTDRCVSMFFHLYWQRSPYYSNMNPWFKKTINPKKLFNQMSYGFDHFLELIESSRNSDSIYKPEGLSFTTHTASMFTDIVDDQDNILLTNIFRLENLNQGITTALDACNLKVKSINPNTRINKNKKRTAYSPSKNQRRIIESLFQGDFEIYENAN